MASRKSYMRRKRDSQRNDATGEDICEADLKENE